MLVVPNDHTVRGFDDRFLYYLGKPTSPNVRPGFVAKLDSDERLDVTFWIIGEDPINEEWFNFIAKPDAPPFIEFFVQAFWSEPLPPVVPATGRPFDKEQIKSLIRERFGG